LNSRILSVFFVCWCVMVLYVIQRVHLFFRFSAQGLWHPDLPVVADCPCRVYLYDERWSEALCTNQVSGDKLYLTQLILTL